VNAKWVLGVSVFGMMACGRKHEPKKTTAPQAVSTVAVGMAQMRAGSSSYYLEMASLHERYQDPVRAGEYFQHALDLADGAAQRLPARLELARLKEAQGDLRGATAALEASLADRDQLRKHAGGMDSAYGVGMGSDDFVERLGHLYLETNRLDDAQRLYENAFASTKDPYRRDLILAQEIELFTRAGTLERRIHEKEAALTAENPDEATLHFLAIAYSGGKGTVGLITPGWSVGGPQGGQLDNLIRVYERLYSLHPGDSQLRLALINLYERAGRVDETVALLRAGAQTAPAPAAMPAAPSSDSPACPMGAIVPRPTVSSVSSAAEIVRVLVRANREEEALGETAKLAARGSDKSIGVQAYTTAARLYVEQSRPDLAAQALLAGAKTWRGRDDERELAVERAEQLLRTGKSDELKAVYAQWKNSEDPCLRVEAARREPMLAQMTGMMPVPKMP